MNTKQISYTLLSIILLMLALITSLIYINAGAEKGVSITPGDCLYSERPLVDRNCDNSDPACPETIKIDGGNCKDQYHP